MRDKNKKINQTEWTMHSTEDMFSMLNYANRMAWSEQQLLIIRDMIIEIRWYRGQGNKQSEEQKT